MKIKIFLAFAYQLIIVGNCQLDFSKCGEITETPNQIAQNYQVGEWPWMGSLGNWSDDGKWNHQCGTTLISDTKFITAAHCVENLDNSWMIRHGVAYLNQTQNHGRMFSIEKIYQHPKYIGIAYYDIAILIIPPVNFAHDLRPICLPDPSNFKIDQYDDKLSTLIGWGSKYKTGTASSVLKRTILRIYDSSYCNTTHTNVDLETKKIVQSHLPELFQSSLLCAGYESSEQGSCKGDSGGPLMFYKTASLQYIQVGLVSGGVSKCGDKHIPSYFTRLDDPEIAKFIAAPELSDVQPALDGDQCGRRVNNFDTNFIVLTFGYEPWPWMASLGFYDDNSTWIHICSSTLITKNHFLTAAHCVDSRLQIRVGQLYLDGDIIRNDLKIINSFIHPDYKEGVYYYDVALLVTEGITFSRLIGPICLPSTPSDDVDKYKNDHVEMTSWRHASKKVENVPLKIFPFSYCNATNSKITLSTKEGTGQKLPKLFQNHNICAGLITETDEIDGRGPCKEDTGSPLVYPDLERGGRWIQIAIVLGANSDCGDRYYHYPGIFIRLDDPSIFNFITSTIKNSSK